MKTGTKVFVIAGLVVAASLAVFVGPLASSSPDGLERVASDKGFIESADNHTLKDSPVADYSVRGVDDERWSTGLAGLLGITLTFVIGTGVVSLLRRRARDNR